MANAQDAAAAERLEAELWGLLRNEERAKHGDPRDQRAHLVVLSVNDVHDMLPGRDGRGGGLATLLDRERATLTKDQTLLVTLNGDFLNGTEVSERLLGEHAIELMDHVGIQYVVVGNHEFDFGEAVMRQRLAASRFKWLGANIIDRSTGLLLD
ncbi:hypothetical protein PINS_up021214, partial [Pythium insidiosum]